MDLSLLRRMAALALSAAAAGALLVSPAQAATSKGCEDGAFRVSASGAALDRSGSIPASALSGTVQVRGRYQSFDLDPQTLGVYDFTFTGAPNALDITGG